MLGCLTDTVLMVKKRKPWKLEHPKVTLLKVQLDRRKTFKSVTLWRVVLVSIFCPGITGRNNFAVTVGWVYTVTVIRVVKNIMICHNFEGCQWSPSFVGKTHSISGVTVLWVNKCHIITGRKECHSIIHKKFPKNPKKFIISEFKENFRKSHLPICASTEIFSEPRIEYFHVF